VGQPLPMTIEESSHSLRNEAMDDHHHGSLIDRTPHTAGVAINSWIRAKNSH
jgi:hypothetical protein